MLCSNCHKEGVKVRLVTKTFGKGESLFVIEDVPVLVCPHCHERYLTAETLHEMEEIRRLHRGAQPRQVDVARFGSVA